MVQIDIQLKKKFDVAIYVVCWWVIKEVAHKAAFYIIIWGHLRGECLPDPEFFP